VEVLHLERAQQDIMVILTQLEVVLAVHRQLYLTLVLIVLQILLYVFSLESIAIQLPVIPAN
jgi:hypothetical protein